MADVAFLWHMHQPDYRHPETGDFVLPWVLLHAIKDYSDMACHLEHHPGVRCTVNFVPVLLEQIEDYCDQLATGRMRDPLLRITAHPDPDSLPAADRAWLLDMAFRCHAPTMLEPFAPYRRLRDLLACVKSLDANTVSYLAGSYYADLATWFLLAWTGEGLRRDRQAVPELMAKGGNFDLRDRQRLLAELGDVMLKLIPRYRALSERGQVELSCTPAHHPLSPLMIDFKSARESWPESPLPSSAEYPGGRNRVAAHLAAAAHSHQERFGSAPAGLWPAEGALSAPFLNQIAESGFRWTGSSHGVLRHSAGDGAETTVPWQAPPGTPGDLTLFFRNERLSDLIGFEYATWHGRDAAQHFMSEIEGIDAHDPQALITIFLDGENAWEYFPYNAWHFFSDLYDALEKHKQVSTVTLSAAAIAHHDRRKRLPRLVAGSWVYGTLSTWLGNADKNHAWDLLCEVKQCADRALLGDRLDEQERAAVLNRLAVCESSDWFWWLGDYNSPHSVACFDSLFRENLKSLYRLLRLPIPGSLDNPISVGGGTPEGGGTMRRAT